MVKQVLIIDDDNDISHTIAEMIDAMGLQISHTIASNGLEGLKIIEANQIDCIITDVKMPKCDGLKFATQLKELNINIPIIFISGDGDTDLENKIKNLGGFDFLTKPFTMEDINFLLIDAMEEAS